MPRSTTSCGCILKSKFCDFPNPEVCSLMDPILHCVLQLLHIFSMHALSRNGCCTHLAAKMLKIYLFLDGQGCFQEGQHKTQQDDMTRHEGQMLSTCQLPQQFSVENAVDIFFFKLPAFFEC